MTMLKIVPSRPPVHSTIGLKFLAIATLAITPLLTALLTTPALAHHAMDGRTPASLFEGFLSGLAHPLIGPDHFAFIVAVGLLAVTQARGILIPIAAVLTAMVGTELHLAKLALPGVELWVSGSIVLFGLLLTRRARQNGGLLVGLAAVAGLFHGYAYGEAIFGAEATPVMGYLAGFTTTQLAIALGAYALGKAMVGQGLTLPTSASPTALTTDPIAHHPGPFRSAGFVICGVGLAFFASQVVSLLFPLSAA
jgi:urease accessory protein